MVSLPVLTQRAELQPQEVGEAAHYALMQVMTLEGTADVMLLNTQSCWSHGK
jgi:hypothetical protein